MNEVPNPVKMDYKGQPTVLAAIFVLAGMVFLAPGITERAQAGVTAYAHVLSACNPGPRFFCRVLFTLVSKSLSQGQWTSPPVPSQSCWASSPVPSSCSFLLWSTKGNPVGSTEEGSVTYKVENLIRGGYFTATLNFRNPATHIPLLDVNTCKITTSKGSISPPTGEMCKVSNKLKDHADWTYTLKG